MSDHVPFNESRLTEALLAGAAAGAAGCLLGGRGADHIAGNAASGIARGVDEAVRDSDKSGKPGNEAGAAIGNAVRSGIQGAVDELLSTPGDVFNHMRNHPVRSGIELLFGVGPLIVDAKVEKLRGK